MPFDNLRREREERERREREAKESQKRSQELFAAQMRAKQAEEKRIKFEISKYVRESQIYALITALSDATGERIRTHEDYHEVSDEYFCYILLKWNVCVETTFGHTYWDETMIRFYRNGSINAASSPTLSYDEWRKDRKKLESLLEYAYLHPDQRHEDWPDVSG